MSTKKSAALLAFVGAFALAVTGPATLASPLPPSPSGMHEGAAISQPPGGIDTALTSKSGLSGPASTAEEDPARLVGVIVQLEDGASRDAAISQINEAVASAFPGASAHVEREYDKALQGFALSAPAGSLDAIRNLPGVRAAFLEREGHVSDVAAPDAEGGIEASQATTQDPANLSAQLMMRTDQVAQKGEGTVIAVIDTGVDMTHQAFMGELASAPTLTPQKVAAMTSQLGEGKTGVYVSQKFPFAYDYADGDNDASPREGGSGFHGTHVAGICAGNADKIVGTAPNAQVIVAKVTRTEDDALLDSALLASLDDMLVLHPDVINLSLGWTAGMDSEADSVYATVYKKLQEAGITVNAASGNAFSTGYGNNSGKGLPYATDPDSSVMDEPATYSSVVAVASVENALIRNAFTVNGKDIGYQRSRGMNGEKVAYFSDLPAGTYEYVDAGFASEEDAAALAAKYPEGLAGKIALVSRGKMTYQKKVENLYDLHPAGILVYNNVSVGSLIIMNLTTQDVPAAFISQADGQAMLDAPEHRLSIAEGQVLPQSTIYEASEFSAWGVSPDLRLKPEIAAPGGNVFSAIPNGAYEQTSGTSMATPQMAGISAIVLQRVQSDPLFASMSAREKVEVVQNLIMGTARPLTDAAQTSGVLYSPRKQGAGLVDALAATTSSVYPTVVGAPEQSRPKADLGDGTKGWHFDVTLHNLSGVEATYELSSQALSEIVEGGFFTEHSSDWRGRGVEIRYSGGASAVAEGASVTVPASGEVTVGIDVTPGAEFASYVAQSAPNGTFLDGFVRFASKTGGQPDLTVPYLGFYGDWGKAPIFDALASEGGAHTLASGIYNGTTGQLLGYNPLIKAADRRGAPNPDRYVISRSPAMGAPTVLEPRTGTLRSVHSLTSTYTYEGGAIVASVTNHRNWKSVYVTSMEENTWVEAYHDPTAFTANMGDFVDLPSGMYTLRIAASNDGPSSAEQSISYKFRLDTTAPVISNLVYSGMGEGFVVTFDVTDDSPLAAVDLHDPADGLWFYRHVFTEDEGSIGPNGEWTYHVEIPLSEIYRAWTEQGGTGDVIANPYVLAWDYGLNPSAAFPIDVPSNNTGSPRLCSDPEGGNWVKDGIGWWYACADGRSYLKGGWFTINGRDYLFGPSGYMATGFLKRVDGRWVYADQDGALASGWIRDGGQWYYLDPATKVMATGWVADGGSWYYLSASGAMATGWVQVDGSWYYLSSSGTMATGWIKVGGLWYYLGPDGAMLTGTQVINGRTYVFDGSGAWVG
ncbi:S8 family serine peptidase [Schaalia odontolytica]|uniref:PII-type proteinase n=4 Tax=Schaalia odontolytica TaxID=1660 RepID=A0A2X0UI47_9ACTO|nr:S8 family serine peptidase [Schaalia odontolytica]WMS26529.1 S8 family serine peptidase [Schaalia odontolytica]SPT55310.1 PII-type proteinase precursor [Schaalia odontolytica]